jgi:PIN domain nuclease of toxin-antitoxin system
MNTAPLLIDTHVLIWWICGDKRLSKKVLRTLEETADVRYSIVSLWEIGLKMSGKGFNVPLPAHWEIEIPRWMDRYAVILQPVTPRHCRVIQDLPLHHKDPFDRMLVAQALDGHLTLASKDPWLDDYGVNRIW